MKHFLFFTVSMLASTLLQAATIDFESIPESTPSDKLTIQNQFASDFGVTFSLSNGSFPKLEAVGGADTGNGFFNQALNLNDTAAPTFETALGSFYLRIGTGNFVEGTIPSLVISYTTPVAAASAQIWDIDGYTATERWQVDALNSTGTVIDSAISPIGTTGALSLDGKPWTWSFNHGASEDIWTIHVTYVGTPGPVGLAFDNFSPSSASVVPEPATVSLLVPGLLAILVISRHRRQRAKALDTMST